MKNLENNRISYVLPEEKKARITDLLNQLNDEFDFVKGLTNEERRELPKINKSNKLFVQDAIAASQENSEIFPSYIQPEEVKKDYNLFEDIDPILLSLESLYNKVRDTQMLAGSEAYSSSLMIYRMFKSAADTGVPGTQAIYNGLKERFAHNQSNKEEQQTDIPEEPTE
jgi:hypothetical protein